MGVKLIGPPNERQKLFLTATERFVAYGGARGGGKSWAVRQKAKLLAANYPGIKILIMRRTFPELQENHILPLTIDLAGVARLSKTERVFEFPNKSRIRFGYCDSESDVGQYQGQEYDVIFIDEATQFTEFMYDHIRACNRGINDFPKRIYLTCNPGGVGHGWVKRLFIDRQYKPGENPQDYRFIPAKVYDNEALLQSDPQYLANLESLPEDLRRAWLEGDWNVFAGQYFTEFRTAKHVCEPFEIPGHWRRYVSLDYGLDMLACYWSAFDGRGRGYIYRELYQPNLVVSDAAARIRALTGNEPVSAFFAPTDLWGRSAETGISQAERFAKCGVPLAKVRQMDRVSGWMSVKEWLKEADGEPSLQIFSTCPNLIRCLPLLLHDQHRPNDCAAEPHEITHAPDALRYLLAGRPARARIPEPDNPFEPERSGDEALAMFGI